MLSRPAANSASPQQQSTPQIPAPLLVWEPGSDTEGSELSLRGVLGTHRGLEWRGRDGGAGSRRDSTALRQTPGSWRLLCMAQSLETAWCNPGSSRERAGHCQQRGRHQERSRPPPAARDEGALSPGAGQRGDQRCQNQGLDFGIELPQCLIALPPEQCWVSCALEEGQAEPSGARTPLYISWGRLPESLRMWDSVPQLTQHPHQLQFLQPSQP